MKMIHAAHIHKRTHTHIYTSITDRTHTQSTHSSLKDHTPPHTPPTYTPTVWGPHPTHPYTHPHTHPHTHPSTLSRGPYPPHSYRSTSLTSLIAHLAVAGTAQ